MKTKQLLLTVSISVTSALAAVFGYNALHKTEHFPLASQQFVNQPVRYASYTSTGQPVPIDFTYAAKLTTPGVVHVTTVSSPKRQAYHYYNPFRDFFGDDNNGFYGQQNQPVMASGSGVIISGDGYIVTNNHVVNGADEISVILNDNKKYTAKVVGTDPSTDVALLKIDEKNLPYIPFGNSDSVQVGAWVLAVGNPFNLASTVTAGIVSAKGRNINILDDNAAIESFIQTDAAVNPGNSGGALVDISGNLIGINTAIASPNGTFAGYSFAVPSNLVYKVVNDLKEYGMVQRGFLGVNIRPVDSDLASEKKLNDVTGVYIENVMKGGAASDAGLKEGDVIHKVDGIAVNSPANLQEVVGQHSPGDKLEIVYTRDGKEHVITTTLKNKEMGTDLLKKSDIQINDLLGVEFQEVPSAEKRKLNIDGGVKVAKIKDGRISEYTDMKPGFIITRIDRAKVSSVDDVNRLLSEKKGGVMIEGVYPDYPGTYYYAFGL